MIPIVLTRDGALLYTDLTEIHEVDPDTEKANSILPHFQLTDSPNTDPGLSTVTLELESSVSNGRFGFTTSNLTSHLEPWRPFGLLTDFSPDKYVDNSHMVILETGWDDLRQPYSKKTFKQIRIKTDRKIPAHVFLEARTDQGINRQKWKEDALDDDGDIQLRVNMRGKRIMLRIIMICFNEMPTVIRGVSVSFLTSGNRVD